MANNVTLMAAQARINKMLKQGHFSICDIDDACSALGINARHSEAYKTLRALHCVDYSAMPAALKLELPSLLAQVFSDDNAPLQVILQPASVPSFQVLAAPAEPVEPDPEPATKRSGLRRLLGIGGGA